MTRRAWLLVAVAAFAGARVPAPIPLIVAIGLVALAAALGRPLAIALTIGVLVSSLAQRSWDGLEYTETATVSGTATVVSDPERWGAAQVAVVRLDGRRYLASAWGATGFSLSQVAAGDRIEIAGSVARYGGSRERRAALHVSHRLSIGELSHVDGGGVVARAANATRTTISRGSAGLGADRQGLFVGLVYGDDRNQNALLAADFRVAGLTHLLAVSGQNVAYILVLLRPLTGRLRPSSRTIVLVAAIGFFATVTRFEASVLRAGAMASIAVVGRGQGREVDTLTVLAAAVTGLLVVDPLLAETVAFQLSVGATVGITVLASSVAAAIPGPRWLADGLAVTVAAQLGVAPVLVSVFGPISLATLPANLLAGPAAGLVMMWGMSAGLVAGFAPAPVATLIHQPTTLLLWWLELVARTSSSLPLPAVGLGWIGVAAAVLVALHVVWGFDRRVAVAVGAPLVGLLAIASMPRDGVTDIGDDSVAIRSGEATMLVLGGERSVTDLIDDLRTAGYQALDVVVAKRPEGIEAAALLSQRLPIGEVWAPADRGGARRVTTAIRLELDVATIEIVPVDGALAVGVDAGSGEATE